MGEFSEVYHHRLRYFLTPQFDLYRNIRRDLAERDKCIRRRLVLDYGCGSGVGSVLLCDSEWEIVGVDSDEEAIAFAKDSWGHLCTFRRDDWTRLEPDFKSQMVDISRRQARFDDIVCLEVIEHVEDPQRLIDSFYEALRIRSYQDRLHDASVYISTLNHNSQYRKNRGHIGKFCIDDFSALVRSRFPEARIFDYTLKNELEEGSSITPMVAIWRNEK